MAVSKFHQKNWQSLAVWFPSYASGQFQAEMLITVFHTHTLPVSVENCVKLMCKVRSLYSLFSQS